MTDLAIDPVFAQRNVNEGFSGGEKKRHEILQLELLDPKIAILDETDSGLDIDALKVVADGVNRYRAKDGPRRAADHALHPDPAVRAAGLRARVRRRPDRRARAARSWPSSWRPAATRSSSRRGLRHDLRCGQDPEGLPDPGAPGPRRAAAGLPGQREHLAEAPPGDRRDVATSTSGTTRTSTAASHQLGEEATAAYEGARLAVASFIGARDATEVVFTKNISEGINLVAYALSNAATAGQDAARLAVGPGDEIVITEMEHHSNIVPWQLLCQRTGATLRWFGVTDDGRLDLSQLDELITERTKLVALAHQSNVLGTVNPVKLIAARAHAGRRAGAGRRGPVGPAPAGRRAATWASTSSASPGTRCAARPASGCSGRGASCWRPCRRSWAAAR